MRENDVAPSNVMEMKTRHQTNQHDIMLVRAVMSHAIYHYYWLYRLPMLESIFRNTVKNLKFGTAQTIATIVLKIEKFDVTLH